MRKLIFLIAFLVVIANSLAAQAEVPEYSLEMKTLTAFREGSAITITPEAVTPGIPGDGFIIRTHENWWEYKYYFLPEGQGITFYQEKSYHQMALMRAYRVADQYVVGPEVSIDLPNVDSGNEDISALGEVDHTIVERLFEPWVTTDIPRRKFNAANYIDYSEYSTGIEVVYIPRFMSGGETKKIFYQGKSAEIRYGKIPRSRPSWEGISITSKVGDLENNRTIISRSVIINLP